MKKVVLLSVVCLLTSLTVVAGAEDTAVSTDLPVVTDPNVNVPINPQPKNPKEEQPNPDKKEPVEVEEPGKDAKPAQPVDPNQPVVPVKDPKEGGTPDKDKEPEKPETPVEEKPVVPVGEKPVTPVPDKDKDKEEKKPTETKEPKEEKPVEESKEPKEAKSVVGNDNPQPVVIETGETAVEASNGQVTLRSKEGVTRTVDAKEIGGKANEDGSVTLQSKGKAVTLPQAGTESSFAYMIASVFAAFASVAVLKYKRSR